MHNEGTPVLEERNKNEKDINMNEDIDADDCCD